MKKFLLSFMILLTLTSSVGVLVVPKEVSAVGEVEEANLLRSNIKTSSNNSDYWQKTYTQVIQKIGTTDPELSGALNTSLPRVQEINTTLQANSERASVLSKSITNAAFIGEGPNVGSTEANLAELRSLNTSSLALVEELDTLSQRDIALVEASPAGRAAAEEVKKLQAPKPATCDLYNIPKCLDDFFSKILIGVAYYILTGASWVVYLAAKLFNAIFVYSIVEIGEQLDNGAINTTWVTVRDFANMFFIFILLYAAIKAVLGASSETKKIVTGVIVVAILINFSLIFTKILVDVSNTLTVAIYNKVLTSAGTEDLSIAIANSLKITTLYNQKEAPALDLGKKPNESALAMAGGSAILLIVAFVLFTMAFMFLTRLVVIFFLMILSPLAFASSMLPGSGHFKKWSESLTSQLVFAPAFMLFFYLALEITKNLGIGTTNTDGLLTAITGGDTKMLMNFAIIITFFIASMIIAKQIATKSGGFTAKGFGIADKVRGWTQGVAGRNTIGALGNRLDRYAGNTVIGNSRAGRFLRTYTTGGAANLKFGSGTSRAQAYKAEEKKKGEVDKKRTEILVTKAESGQEKVKKDLEQTTKRFKDKEEVVSEEIKKAYETDAGVQTARQQEETGKTDLEAHRKLVKQKEEEVKNASLFDKPQKQRDLDLLKQQQTAKEQQLTATQQARTAEEKRVRDPIENTSKNELRDLEIKTRKARMDLHLETKQTLKTVAEYEKGGQFGFIGRKRRKDIAEKARKDLAKLKGDRKKKSGKDLLAEALEEMEKDKPA